MEAVGPDSCGTGDKARGAEGRPAPEARVHFRVTRFIMEAGNRGWEAGWRSGNPPLGEGDAQDAALAQPVWGEEARHRGIGPGLHQRPACQALSCKAATVTAVCRTDAQAQREDVERGWPRLGGRRVGVPAAGWPTVSSALSARAWRLSARLLVRLLTSLVGDVPSHR